MRHAPPGFPTEMRCVRDDLVCLQRCTNTTPADPTVRRQVRERNLRIAGQSDSRGSKKPAACKQHRRGPREINLAVQAGQAHGEAPLRAPS